jgi:hypothetical protein
MAIQSTPTRFSPISFSILFAVGFSLSASGVNANEANATESSITQNNTTQSNVAKTVKAKEYQPSVVDAEGNKRVLNKSLIDGKLPQNTASTNSASVQNGNTKTGAKASPAAKALYLNRETARATDDPDFWIYDSYVTLDFDIDYDGYYSTFTLEFDVDTVYQRAGIYAEIYSTTSDVFTLFYTTDIYRINGDSTNDSIVVENTLVTGFPSNDYELMIVIYDADTDEVVAVSDGTDDADLAFLSLESENYEYVEPVDVIVVESGGSLGLFGLFGLSLLVVRRVLR